MSVLRRQTWAACLCVGWLFSVLGGSIGCSSTDFSGSPRKEREPLKTATGPKQTTADKVAGKKDPVTDQSIDQADESSEQVAAEVPQEEVLLGIPVAKVGMNFDNAYPAYVDYNDAVLCFTGMFKVDQSVIRSEATQRVVFELTNHTGGNCSHRILVDIGPAEPAARRHQEFLTPLADGSQTLELEFERGDYLEVRLQSLPGSHPACISSTGTPVDHHTATHAQILLDQCNQGGD